MAVFGVQNLVDLIANVGDVLVRRVDGVDQKDDLSRSIALA